MNILLIGGNGFVGQALIKEFKKYNVKVSYISRTQNHSIYKDEATWIHGDIFDIENILINEKYDIAIHLIGTIKDKNLYSNGSWPVTYAKRGVTRGHFQQRGWKFAP